MATMSFIIVTQAYEKGNKTESNTKANPIEILYNEFGSNGVNVFHAMPCQSRFLRLLEKGETGSYYDGN